MEDVISFEDLPTDAFVQILLRIAPSKRRRLRLVCRRWRNVIDSRAPVRQSRVKTLVYLPAGTAAYVLDDLAEGCYRELWNSAANPDPPACYSRVRMVGTCNGLICLYDECTGDIVLLNPVTGETLDIPGPPGHRLRQQGFTYHEATERYKIVHLAVNEGALEAVELLTLGEDASWRKMRAPARSICSLWFGVVSDDQATYWITRNTGDADMLRSFDLTNERLEPVRSLPAAANKFFVGCLRKVHGRLCVGVHIRDYENNTEIDEMWLLEREGWRCRFYLTTRRCMQEVSLPPPVVVEEEVKEVLSETAVSVSRPRPPEPEKEVVKRRLERKEEEEASESVASAAAEKAKAKCGGEREGEQKAVVGGMEKGRARTRTPEQRRPKEAGNGRTRSPSPHGSSILALIALLFFATAATPPPSRSVIFLGSFRSPGTAAMFADGVAAYDAGLARGEWVHNAILHQLNVCIHPGV
ncbi:hypothetical protein E2562_031646 [Oryza meyeriana var. granulata]|uniref:F-box domain-containing protein n=1 Tax=Oryza meyeriana var. granulata TaxID=110450 RepID=A0A6G1DAI0_9ORYZ|nr:hypothetical protein E2562_031646 [Oryza meyeriana var. granulata]